MHVAVTVTHTRACTVQYVSEAAGALAEAPKKPADVAAALHVAVALHQRYAEFGPALRQELLRAFGVGTKLASGARRWRVRPCWGDGRAAADAAAIPRTASATCVHCECPIICARAALLLAAVPVAPRAPSRSRGGAHAGQAAAHRAASGGRGAGGGRGAAGQGQRAGAAVHAAGESSGRVPNATFLVSLVSSALSTRARCQ